MLLTWPAAAQTGRVAVIYADGQPTVQMWRRLTDTARQRSNGAIDWRVFPGGQLGGEREVAEGIRLGSIQAADNTLASLSAWVPEGQVFDLPFIFRDLGHIERVMAGPIGARFSALYQAQGFRVLGYIVYGARGLVSRRPIAVPGDVRGLAMRVIQSPLHIALWRLIGANPTPIPITEAYNALDTGVVQLMDMTRDGYEALRLYEVAPYYIDTRHIWSVGAVIVAERIWTRLDAAQQQILREAAADAIPFFERIQDELQIQALARTVARGARASEPDPAPWRAATQSLWASEAPRLGGMDLIRQIADTP